MTRTPTHPTVLQAEAYETAMRLGSQSAAAKALGRHQGSVRGDIIRYTQITGAPLPPGVTGARRPPSAASVMAQVPSRLAAIEAELAATRVVVDRLTSLVESFVHRQPIVLETRPVHRRIADGGEGGRRERGHLTQVVGSGAACRR